MRWFHLAARPSFALLVAITLAPIELGRLGVLSTTPSASKPAGMQ